MEEIPVVDPFIHLVNSLTQGACFEEMKNKNLNENDRDTASDLDESATMRTNSNKLLDNNSEIDSTQIKQASDSSTASVLNGVAKTDDSNTIECDSKSQADNLVESRESLLLTLLDNESSTFDKVEEDGEGEVKSKFDETTEKQKNETESESDRSTSQKCETDDAVTSPVDATIFEKQADNQFEQSNASKAGEKVDNRSNSSHLETSNDKSTESAAVKNTETKTASRPLFKRKLKSSLPSSSRKVRTKSLNVTVADSSNSECTTSSQPNKAEKSLYSPGMIVWARIPGYTYWPAMIDNDPDTHWHFWPTDDVTTPPTHYHVVFFDTNNRLSRSWVKPNNIKLFTEVVRINSTRPADYLERFKKSVREAQDAASLNVKERLKKYSFSERIKLPGMKLCQD